MNAYLKCGMVVDQKRKRVAMLVLQKARRNRNCRLHKFQAFAQTLSGYGSASRVFSSLTSV